MASPREGEQASQKRQPPPPPNPRRARRTSIQASPIVPARAVFSTYRMNDIPNGTHRSALINSLLAHGHDDSDDERVQTPADVMFGLIVTNSRLDDELSTAIIEFSNTPRWLRRLNRDPCGFPKKTPLGTLWRGVDPNAVDGYGQTEFIRAVLNDATDIYYPEMLAEFADTDVNIQDQQGRTALHWACARNLSVMVQLCLSVPECDVGLRDNDGLTAFDLTGNEDIQNLFYCNVLKIEDSNPEEALLRVLSVTSAPVRADMPVFPGLALFDPIQHRNQRLVKALIDRGVDLTARNEHGDTALHVAAAQPDTLEITTLLLQAGSDVNALGNGGATPLQCAAQAGQLDTEQLLLGYGGATPLQCAARVEQLNTEQLLLGHGAGIRTTEGGGETTLSFTEDRQDLGPFTFRRRATIKRWVSRFHDIESVDADGYTALHQAVMKGDLELVQELLRQGADTESKSARGETALLVAAHWGATDIVKRLLVSGAQTEAISSQTYYFPVGPGAIPSSGHTALSLAALGNHREIVKELAARGANFEARDSNGSTALALAAKRERLETMTTLLEFGAQHTVETRLRYMFLRGRRFTVSQDKRGPDLPVWK